MAQIYLRFAAGRAGVRLTTRFTVLGAGAAAAAAAARFGEIDARSLPVPHRLSAETSA